MLLIRDVKNAVADHLDRYRNRNGYKGGRGPFRKFFFDQSDIRKLSNFYFTDLHSIKDKALDVPIPEDKWAKLITIIFKKNTKEGRASHRIFNSLIRELQLNEILGALVSLKKAVEPYFKTKKINFDKFILSIAVSPNPRDLSLALVDISQTDLLHDNVLLATLAQYPLPSQLALAVRLLHESEILAREPDTLMLLSNYQYNPIDLAKAFRIVSANSLLVSSKTALAQHRNAEDLANSICHMAKANISRNDYWDLLIDHNDPLRLSVALFAMSKVPELCNSPNCRNNCKNVYQLDREKLERVAKLYEEKQLDEKTFKAVLKGTWLDSMTAGKQAVVSIPTPEKDSAAALSSSPSRNGNTQTPALLQPFANAASSAASLVTGGLSAAYNAGRGMLLFNRKEIVTPPPAATPSSAPTSSGAPINKSKL